MKNSVWLIIGCSESLDTYFHVSSVEPAGEFLEKLCYYWDGNKEKRSGCGEYGSNIHLTVEPVEIDADLK